MRQELRPARGLQGGHHQRHPLRAGLHLPRGAGLDHHLQSQQEIILLLQIILKREHEIGNNYLSLKLKSFVVKVRPLRVLRQYAFSRAFGRLDAASKYPMVIRMIKTINIMVILMHVLGTAPIYMLQFSCHLTASTSSC